MSILWHSKNIYSNKSHDILRVRETIGDGMPGRDIPVFICCGEAGICAWTPIIGDETVHPQSNSSADFNFSSLGLSVTVLGVCK